MRPVKKLIIAKSNDPVKLFTPLKAVEDLYSVIQDTHTVCDHGGKRRTGTELDLNLPI